VEAEQVPISGEAEKSEDPLNSALNDGEDFELLFTVSEEDYQRLLRQWSGPVAITQIGTINDGGKVQIRMLDGGIEDLQPGGYDHLK
jgi:thiamine-monophosphate kinase